MHTLCSNCTEFSKNQKVVLTGYLLSAIMSLVLRTATKCASGSVVEYRLAKARVAGSNPVSRL